MKVQEAYNIWAEQYDTNANKTRDLEALSLRNSLAELKFGVENSEHREKNKKALDNFLTGVQVLPIFHSLDLYGKEKARLRKAGTPIDDFDLLIGVTSVNHKLIMVTNNSNHFKRISGIKLEDWTETK